jgi:hypothetical protein
MDEIAMEGFPQTDGPGTFRKQIVPKLKVKLALSVRDGL